MEPINSRIATLVQKSGKTKTEWANRLNVTPQFISSLCNGKKAPSSRTILDICREFNVNEAWLREGSGPMFRETPPESVPLEELLNRPDIKPEDRALVKSFLELSEESRDAVIEFVQKCAAALSAPAEPARTESDVEARLAELERQLAAERARADAAEAEAKAKTEELLAVYREDAALLEESSGFPAEKKLSRSR